MPVPHELLLAVPPTTWRDLLAQHAPWLRVPRAATQGAIANALTSALADPRCARPLARALDRVALLATPMGREALLDAAIDVGTDIATWPRDEGPQALAARLLVESATDPDAAATLDRAEIHVQHHDDDEAPVAYVFRARRAMRPRRTAAQAAATLTEQVDAWCTRYGRAAGSEVHVAPDRHSFSVERTHRYAVTVGRDEKGARRVHGGFPITTDHVALLEDDAWLVVTTSTPRMIGLYRRASGAALYGDEAHFDQEPALSLEPLGALVASDRHEVRLPALAAEVREVRILDLDWDSGDRYELSVRGHDAAEAVRAEGLRVAGRHVAMAKLRVVTSDGRRLALTAWPPHRVRLPRGEAALGLRILQALGATRTARGQRDLWDVATGLRSRDELAEVLGALAETDAGLIAAEQTRGAVHPRHPYEGRALIAYPLPGAGEPRFYGVSTNPTVPSRSLLPAELTMARLDLARLGTLVAQRGGLSGKLRVHASSGLVDLGASGETGPRIRVFLLTRDPAGDSARLATRIRELAGADPVIALVPAGRTADLGLPMLALPALLETLGPLGPAIRAVLGGAASLDPLYVAPPGTRLVVDARAMRAWLDGVELTKLAERHVRLLLALARRPETPIPAKDLDSDASGEPARVLKAKLGPLVAASFAAAGRKPPAEAKELVLREGWKGYRLAVRSFVVT